MKVKVINDNGMIWCVVVNEGPEPLVTFYDCRYEHTQYGQMVSRYFVKTLQEHNVGDTGLDLYGGVPAWKISKEGMERIMAWLKNTTEEV